jgi:hypothetical protein
MILSVGQIIRLNEIGVKWANSAAGTPTRRYAKIPWKDRIGEIKRFNGDKKLAYVLWNGNKTWSEGYPVHLLEPVHVK